MAAQVPRLTLSHQPDKDVARLRRELQDHLEQIRRMLVAIVGGNEIGGTEGTVSLSELGDLTATIVTDHGGLTGLADDDHPQYLRADGTRPLSAGWNVGGFALTGVSALTVTGDVTQSGASPVYFLGNGTGSPTWLANKSDAGDCYAPLWRVAGVNRWGWYFAVDEDLQLLRWNAAGVFQDLTEVSAVDGSWSFPAGINVTGNIAVTGTVDGVDVSAHAARHNAGGADVLALFGAAAQGVVPASGGGTTNFLRADGTWAAPGGGPGGLTLTDVEVNLGTLARYGGTFTIADAGLTPGADVLVVQLAGPYTGKGNRQDEAEMDLITANAYVVDATTIRVYWQTSVANGPVRGNVRFGYAVSA